MIHGMPFHGWIDHGFYCFQPTFYWDLAAANRYEPLKVYVCGITPTKLIQMPDEGARGQGGIPSADAGLLRGRRLPKTARYLGDRALNVGPAARSSGSVLAADGAPPI